MAENRKENEYGLYYFRRGQLLFLAAGFTVTSIVVFLLGILVGQRIEERKIVKKEEPLVRIPAQIQDRAPSAGSANEEMTFYDTLPRPNVGQAEKRVRTPEKTTAASPTEQKPSSAKALPRAEVQGKPLSPKQEEKAKAAAGERPWTVQVNAFPDEEPARSLAERLKGKGYDAYVATANIKGHVWYRVRVGHYQSRDEAGKLQETLRSKENFSKAIIASR